MTFPRGPEPLPELPEGFGIRLDPSTIMRSGGQVLLGGSPRRLLRLSPAAAAVVETWTAGGWPRTSTERRLARILVSRGVANPVPSGGPPWHQVTIVIPVRDRPEQLARCLASLPAELEAVVVDDGSSDERAVATAAAEHGARVLRRRLPGGAAAARNLGLSEATSEIVVFLDSDCVPARGWLEALIPHFADAHVAAVAPRIVPLHERGGGWLATYEATRSPLDQGPAPGQVASNTRVGWVPTAALAVRRSIAGDGFDEQMRIGEDIDFVWRLHSAGWEVRYEPAARVAHDHRAELGAWARRRVVYGSSAALLSLRHPGRLAPAVLTPWSMAFWGLVALGRQKPAVLPLLIGAWGVRGAIGPVPSRHELTMRVIGTGILGSGRTLANAVTRAWLPLVAASALRTRGARRVLVAAWLLPSSEEWLARDPELDPIRYAAMRLLDDSLNCLGLWLGCARDRTLGPVLPRVLLRRADGRSGNAQGIPTPDHQ